MWTLAWPAVALNTLQTFNSLVDNFFLSYVGTDALTAVGASISLVFLFFSMSMALGTASTAIVSRAYGARDHAECETANRKCLSLSIWIGFAVFIIAVPSGIGASHLFVASENAEARSLFVTYVILFATALPPIFVIQSLAGALRGIGDTRSPMVISGFQVVLHIVLNTALILPSRNVGGVLIPGMGLGLAGAGVAMSLSAWVSAFIYLWWSRRTALKTLVRVEKPDREWVVRILRIAIPASIMSIVRVTSLAAFTIILKNSFDAAHAQGALRPGFSIEAFAFMPAFGLSVAAAALVGQSLGMKKPERAEKLGWTAAHQAGIVSAIVSLLLFLFADPIAHLMLAGDPETANVAAVFTRYIAVTEVLFAYAMVLIGAMQGAGDTKRPLWLSLITLWGIRVPLAAILALSTVSVSGFVLLRGMNLGSQGAWISMSVTQAIQGILSIVLFKRGDWKNAKV